MSILRAFAVAVTTLAIASSASAAGFGCGLGWSYYDNCGGCNSYNCNYADGLWAGYQPTQPVYVPRPYGHCDGCAIPRLAGHFKGSCATSACDPCGEGAGGFSRFSGFGGDCGFGGNCGCGSSCGFGSNCGCGNSCGFGGNIGSKLAGAFARLKAHCGGSAGACDAGCCDVPCSGSGYDIQYGYPNTGAPAIDTSVPPAHSGHGAEGDTPVIESRPMDTFDGSAPPMMEHGTSFPPTSAGPFDSSFQLHDTEAPAINQPAAPADQPAELLPPNTGDDSLDGDA